MYFTKLYATLLIFLVGGGAVNHAPIEEKHDKRRAKQPTEETITVNSKLVLTTSMMFNADGTAASGTDEANRLVDEQSAAGDPQAGSGGAMSMPWLVPWSGNAESYIDLGQSYDITAIWIYDGYGTGQFTISVGQPGQTTSTVFDQALDQTDQWRSVLSQTITTQYLTFTKVTADSKVREIVIYGTPSGGGGGNPPNLQLSSTNPTTGNPNGGTITSTVTSGTAPYTYLWNTGASVANLSGLAQGSYSLTVTDNAGLTASGNVTLSCPAAGQSCNDNNPNTTNDVTDGNCGCAGTPGGGGGGGGCTLYTLANATVRYVDGTAATGGSTPASIIDEQPANYPPTNTPTTFWSWSNSSNTTTCYLDFGSPQSVGGLALYDTQWGTAGTVTISEGTPGSGGQVLYTFTADGTGSWSEHTLTQAITTQYLTIVKSTDQVKISEVAVCTGSTASCPFTLSASYGNPACNDEGTNSDPSDDTYSFTIQVSDNGGGGISYHAAIGGITYSNIAYNTNYVIPASYPIALGDKTVTITDANDGTCQIQLTVMAPPTCSGATAPTCSDGIMNGNELGIDCGGDCPNCPTGSPTASLTYPSPTTDGQVQLELQFNHKVYEFEADDFIVENGVIDELVELTDRYDVRLQPIDYSKQTSIKLAANSLFNAIGNENSESQTIFINSTAPNTQCYTTPNNPTENAALAGTATQSSVQAGGTADRGNDGNTDGNFYSNPSSVIYTNWTANPWWEVDLNKQATIREVKIHNRSDSNFDQLDDYYIFISSTPFTTNDINSLIADNTITKLHITELAGYPSSYAFNGEQGRYVRIQLNKTAFLTLAEVEVIADE